MTEGRHRFANTIFLGAAAVCALALAFVLYHQGRLLTSPGRWAFFLGLPATGLVMFLAALRLPGAARSSFAAVTLAVGVAFYAAEFYLAFPAPAPPAAVGKEQGAVDTRTKYQVVQDLRSRGERAYPAVFPAYISQTALDGALRTPLRIDGREVLPLGGVANAPTVLCNESGPYVVYESDAYGFNNPKGLWAAGAVQAIALGDSFTQGYCVAPERNFVSLIRARYPRTLNLGMSGNGPLLMLATLKEYGPTLRPRAALWFFFEGNDVPGDMAVEARNPLLMRYLGVGFAQALMERKTALDGELRGYVDRLLQSSSARRETDAGPLQNWISFIGLAKLRASLDLPSTLGAPDYPLFERVLAEARATVKGWGGRLYFVYLPAYSSVVGPNAKSAPFDQVHGRVGEIVGSLGIPLIDLGRAFRAHKDPSSLFPFRSGGHYNEAGHGLVAEITLEALGPNGAPR